MPPIIATGIFFLLIFGLFVFDRDRRERTASTLWIPGLWLGIIASRPVSSWLADLGLYSSGVKFDSPDAYLDGSPIDRFVFATLLIAAVVVLVGRAPKVADLLRKNIPLVLFLVYCGISTLWAEFTLVGIKRWVKCIGDVAMVSLVLTDPDRKAAIRQLLVRCGFVLIPLSVLLIKFYPDLGRTYHIWTWTYMFTGVTQGKNMLGATCLVFGVASFWCFLAAWESEREAKRIRHLVVHAVLVGMVVWLFLLANSMTSLTCFVIVGILMTFFQLTKLVRRGMMPHLLPLIAIGIPFSALFLGFGDSSLGALGRNSSLTGRTGIWQMVIQMTDNSMFGAGFESFWMGARLARMWAIDGGFFKGIQSAHNGYLEVFVNLGWVGVTLLVGLLLRGYRDAVRAFRHNPTLHTLTVAYIVIAIIYNFTEAGFRMMTPIWFCFVLAIMNATTQSNVGSDEPEHGSGRGCNRRPKVAFMAVPPMPLREDLGAPTRGCN